MVERGTFGGTCVNTGCVPSKALIAAAEARHVAGDASTRFPGIATNAGPVDMPGLVRGKQDLVEALRGEKYVDVADSYGWQVRQGDASFAGTPDAPLLHVTAPDGSVEVIEAADLVPRVVDVEIYAMERAFDHVKYGAFSPSPWLEALIPSLADPSLAPPGAHVLSLYVQYAPHTLRDDTWDAARGAFLEAVLTTLDRYMPGVRSLIVEAEVLTPADLAREWGMAGGHIHHGELALDQLYTMRPLLGWSQYRTPIDGLWLCGAGTHPGLGLTGGSGANAAREILRAG